MSAFVRAAAAPEGPQRMSGPSIKLTSLHRENACAAMISQRFKAEVENEWPRWADLANRAYDRVFDAPMQRKMKALPEGWLPEDDDIMVRLGATMMRLEFSGALTNCHRIYVKGLTWPEKILRRFPASKQATCLLAVEATDELAIAYDTLLAAHRDLNERLTQATAKVSATLGSFTTSRALAEAWPEAMQFLPNAPHPRQAVAIQRADLNALLQLPADAVPA